MAKGPATDGERDDRKGKCKNNQQPGGTKDDETVGGTSSGSKGTQQERQQDHGRETAQRRLQDTLRPISTSARCQGRHLHVLHPSTRNRKSKCAPTRSRRYPWARGAASDPQDSRRSRAYCKRCRREEARWERPMRQEWSTPSKFGTTWSRREHSFDMVPHCKLAKVYDPALCRFELVTSVTEHREYIRGALGHTGANRLLGQVYSGALEWALSSALEQVN